MNLLAEYLRRYPRQIALGLLALLVVDWLNLRVPILIGRAVDHIAASNTEGLFEISLIIAAIAASITALRFVWHYYLFGPPRHYRKVLRTRLYDHLLKQDRSFFEKRPPGELISYSSNDIEAVHQACAQGFMIFADGVFMAVIAIVGMWSLSPRLSLYALLPLPFVSVFVRLAGKQIHRRFKKLQDYSGDFTEKVRECIAGVRVIKSFARERSFLGSFDASSQEYIRLNLEVAKIQSIFDPTIAAIAGISLLIILLIGGEMVIAGTIPIGHFVAFNAYLGSLAWPMTAFGLALNFVQRGRASARRINDLLAIRPQIKEKSPPRPFPEEGHLQINELSYQYDGGAERALHGISLSIPQNSSLGIIGLVGSGKSTLCHLLARLIDPPSGTVQYGGTDLRDLSFNELRRNLVLVTQEPFIFSASIRDNILIGNPAAGEEDLQAALSASALDQDLSQFPKGLDSIVGERGITLSGGQKQRVSLARALISEARILILDDALSAVDSITERRILESLNSAARRRTLIIVSQRVAALQRAERIAVLDEGRIAEQGRHEALLKKGGIYARLHALQRISEDEHGR